MTLDREQIRRDVETWMDSPAELRKAAGWQAEAFAQHCLALLSELEQADQLVKAARTLHAITAEHSLDNDTTSFDTHTDYAAASFALGEALTAYDEARKQ